MKSLLLLLNIVALSSAFTVSSYSGRRATTVHSFGSKIKNMIGRGDKDVTVTEPEDDEVAPISLEMSSEIVEEEEEKSEAEILMQQVKDSGVAGIISYALWELGFWAFSVPVCVFGYREVTGHWPDFQDPEDLKKLGAEAFAFVNFARFAVPLRIGLALGSTPWIQENVVDKYMKKDGDDEVTTEAGKAADEE